jgi:hypothetical protein
LGFNEEKRAELNYEKIRITIPRETKAGPDPAEGTLHTTGTASSSMR